MLKSDRKYARWVALATIVLAVTQVDCTHGQNGPKPETKPANVKRPGPKGPINLVGVDPEVLKPFTVTKTQARKADKVDGHIDWSGKKVVAVGQAIQEGDTPQAMLMARGGARAIALRNALALSLGVRIGINGRVEGMANGKILIQGFIKGFEVTKQYPLKKGGKTYQVVEVHVPMFGIKSLAGRLFKTQLKAHRKIVAAMKRATWIKPAPDAAVAGDVLIIDARGMGFQPSMYPLVQSEDGRIVIDMDTVPEETAVGQGLCAYATTKLPFKRLQAGAPLPAGSIQFVGLASRPGSNDDTNVDGVPMDQILLAQAANLTADADAKDRAKPRPQTAPAKPVKKRRRRRKARRYTVRATRTPGKKRATLVLADRESLKMLKDPKAANLARNGRVLIIVDAAAAGMEGILPPAWWLEHQILARASADRAEQTSP